MDPPQTFQVIPVLFMGFCLLFADLLFYGFFVPIIGATVATSLARTLAISGFYEILLVILIVSGMFYLMFTGFRFLRFEPRFWRNLFAGDKGYATILQIRDLVNLFTLYLSIRLLYDGIIGTSEMEGIGLKDVNLGDGIGFVLWNGLAEQGFEIPDYISERYSWTPEVQRSSFWSWSTGTSSMCEQNMKNMQMINGAKLVLAIAGITASVMKLSYFAVLHTYLRAMKIFTAMQDASPPQSREGSDSIHSIVSESVTYNFNNKDLIANNGPHRPTPTQSNTTGQRVI